MWQIFRNAWKIADLRKKIIYTLFMLLVFRLASYIPVPGVNTSMIASTMEQFSLLGFVDLMTGGSLENYTIMAMGITPYINASIIMQLLTVAIPKLEALQKEGEEGRKKIAQITRYVTVGLGFFQALGLTIGLRAAANASWLSYITIGICLAAGTAMAMWIGERITENGIGNGVSLLIFSGIIARLFTWTYSGISAIGGDPNLAWNIIPIVLGIILLVVAVVYVDLGERRVPVTYAKRVVGRKMYGGQSSHIPMRVNASGVLPLIFAYSIMQFPGTIMGFFPEAGITIWWSKYMGAATWANQVVMAILILFFTYFYNSISFNPVDISKNLQQNGGMIPGVRQGKPTSDFLARISSRITLFGAVFLALLATLPTIVTTATGMTLPFAASSLLIAVSVSIETTKQLESQMLMRHYKGFLK